MTHNLPNLTLLFAELRPPWDFGPYAHRSEAQQNALPPLLHIPCPFILLLNIYLPVCGINNKEKYFIPPHYLVKIFGSVAHSNGTMGNCAFKGNAETSAARRSAIIRVATHNGGVMELYPPVTAECITNGFPGHGVYRSHEKFTRPLLHNEELAAGELYYLRPVNSAVPSTTDVAPYRVSFDQHRLWRRNEEEASEDGVKCANRIGMWKVKLVISPAQLAEILSQESRTEALIESVRTVAKCGNGSAAGSSVASSDQWSLASSRKAASESTIG